MRETDKKLIHVTAQIEYSYPTVTKRQSLTITVFRGAGSELGLVWRVSASSSLSSLPLPPFFLPSPRFLPLFPSLLPFTRPRLSPSLHPSLFVRSKIPKIVLGGLGERCKLPQWGLG